MSSVAFSTTRPAIPTSYEAPSMTASRLGMAALATIWLTTTSTPDVQALSRFVDTSKAVMLPQTRGSANNVAKEGEQVNQSDLGQMFAQITANISNEEWKNIPSDFSKNFRQYMYGDRS